MDYSICFPVIEDEYVIEQLEDECDSKGIPICDVELGPEETIYKAVQEPTRAQNEDKSAWTVKDDNLCTKFGLDIRLEGKFRNANSIIVIECTECTSAPPFSNIAHFFCHYVMEHQKLLNFQCYICAATVNCLSFCDHFVEHHSLLEEGPSHLASVVLDDTPLDTHGNNSSYDQFFKEINEGGCVNYECSNCSDVFDTNEKCLTHWKEKHQPLEWRKRQTKIRKGKKAKVNLVEINGVPRALCSFCGKTFSKAAQMKIHMRYHTGEKPYKCDECGKMFAKGYCYKQHLLSHSQEKRHLCQTCGKSFTQKSSFIKHPCNRVNTEKKTYHCDICDKILGSRDTMIVHMRIHTKEKPFKCELCLRAFSSNSSKRRHMHIHSDDSGKPIDCKFCHRKFRSMEAKKQHELTHGDLKPTQCEFCPKIFLDLASRKKHLLVHLTKQHQCDFCLKCFVNAESLKNHIQDHPECEVF